MHSWVLIPVCSRHDLSAASDSWRSCSSAYSRCARSFEAIKSGQSLFTIVLPTRRAGASGSHDSFSCRFGFAAVGALLGVFAAGRAVVVEAAVDTLGWVTTLGPADVGAELVDHVGSVGVAGRSGEQADTATIRTARPTNLSTLDCRTSTVFGYEAGDGSTVRGGAQRGAKPRAHGALVATLPRCPIRREPSATTTKPSAATFPSSSPPCSPAASASARHAPLLWRSVDLDTGTLEVEATVVRIKGQGLLRKTTKTTAGHRILRLPRWCVEMLRERAALIAPPADSPVFAAPLGNLRDASNPAADLRDAFDNAGFGWATSHVLRKTTASVLDAGGLSAREIADQLGHARPSITMDRYMGRKIASDRGATVLESLA